MRAGIAQAARSDDGARPTQGWETVSLPDVWTQRWPGYGGSVWYRIPLERDCSGTPSGSEIDIESGIGTGTRTGTGIAANARSAPSALAVSGMGLAGEVFLNDDTLWRDAAMVEPLSRSWNMPRAFVLPESALRPEGNAVWARVVGDPALSPGLGAVSVGPVDQVMAIHESNLWRQRTVFQVNLGLSAAVGCLFLVVWALRRAEVAAGWYAAMSLCWVAYLVTLLTTEPWPWEAALSLSRINVVFFVLYTACFCMFTFRFGQQVLPRTQRLLWSLVALGTAGVLLAPAALLGKAIEVVWIGFVLILFANCVQFQWHAWRTRKFEHVMLALCWLLLLVVGVHDLVIILTRWSAHETWAAVTGPLATAIMSVVLGGRLVANTRRIERFNHELSDAVADARVELAQVLAREHAHALDHTKMQERMQIAHDLHDGLGGSLVRSMALVELSAQPLPNARVLSLLKVLRDDLRQVIDHGSSVGANVPESPTEWAAPLRHRFTRILDDMGVVTHWNIDTEWHHVPSALQCLGLTRLVEEALSNVIKHSKARTVRIDCTQWASAAVNASVGTGTALERGAQPPRTTLSAQSAQSAQSVQSARSPQRPQTAHYHDGHAPFATLYLCIADDGVGFDVPAVQHAGLSVGMRSMAARAERLGGTLQVVSGPTGTRLVVQLRLAPGATPG